jgi:hypothetical protein
MGPGFFHLVYGRSRKDSLDLVAECKDLLGINLSTQNWQELCAVLNEFALPRAIFDFERQSFVAWNAKFLEKIGYSAEEIKSTAPAELLTLGETWFPLSSEKNGPRVEFTSSTVRRAAGVVPGFVVRAHHKIGYLMLDVFDEPSAQFEQGRLVGREEERERIAQAYHEEASSSMIAALFLIETAKSELREADLPQSEAVSKASENLAEATEKIADVLCKSGDNSLQTPGPLHASP